MGTRLASFLRLVSSVGLVGGSFFLAQSQSSYEVTAVAPLLTSSVTALSIGLASLALYGRDFLVEMDMLLDDPALDSQEAGERIAKEYKQNFALLLAASVFLTIAIFAFLTAMYFADGRATRIVALWAFISGFGVLLIFLLSFTVRLISNARFYGKRFARQVDRLRAAVVHAAQRPLPPPLPKQGQDGDPAAAGSPAPGSSVETRP